MRTSIKKFHYVKAFIEIQVFNRKNGYNLVGVDLLLLVAN